MADGRRCHPDQPGEVALGRHGATARELVRSLTVVLELEWVLRSRYALGKPDILLALNTLLEVRELEIQSEPAVERALHAYRMGNADFADCLHAGACWSAGKAPLLTLDAKAARLSDAQLLRG